MFAKIKQVINKKYFALVKNTSVRENNNIKYKIFDKIKINDII